jgi:hypothetical protein
MFTLSLEGLRPSLPWRNFQVVFFNAKFSANLCAPLRLCFILFPRFHLIPSHHVAQ